MTTDNETVADVADLALLREILGDSPAARMLIELETLRAEKAAHAREVEALREQVILLVEGAYSASVSASERNRCIEALRARAEAAEAMAGEQGLLRLLVDLRFALGDNGKRMQDELVEYARDLAADARRWRHVRDEMTYHYGDGQTEPRECGIHLEWVQGPWVRDGSNGGSGRPDWFPGWDAIVDEAITKLADELRELDDDAAIASGGEG